MSNRWSTSRTEAFSDGVFAIAVTLLVLDLNVPETAYDDLWAGIGHQWPSYLAYVTSFISIGGFWLAHHSIFRRLDSIDNTIMRINLVLLMTVSFLPFPTRLLADAVRTPTAERDAVIFYGISLVVISLLFSALWLAATRRPGLLNPDVTQMEVRRIQQAMAPNIGLYVGMSAFAFVAPRGAALGYLVIAVVSVVRARGDTGRSRAAAEPG